MDVSALNVATFALIGFIVGWGLEFVLDFFYWRRRRPQVYRPAPARPGEEVVPQAAHGGDDMLHKALAERDEALLQARRQVSNLNEDLAHTRLTVRDYDLTIANLRHQLDERQTELSRLRATTPADELAARDVEISTLRAQVNSSQSAIDDLSKQVSSRTTELEQLRAQLAARPQASDLETLQAEINARTSELAELQGRLDSHLSQTAELESFVQQRDEEIRQLERRLREASAELDHLRQRELDRLVIEETEYIHEDDLSDIKGIGDVYAERLREAGFYTFQHLADAEADELKQALEIPNWRTPNLQSWIDQARDLAEQKEQEEE